jgi:catechol-2,3-dioxygenase
MKLNLDTIIMFVQNVDKLKRFYVDALKLDVIEEQPSAWVLLKAGDSKIGLHKIGDQYLDKNVSALKFDNNVKIVFEVDEDIRQVRQQLIDKNVAMKDVTTFNDYHYWLCDGEDPEGNVFQLKQKKKNG